MHLDDTDSRTARSGDLLPSRVLESAGVALCCRDLEGRILFLNREAERLLGRSRADALGKPCREVMGHHGGEGRPCCEFACPGGPSSSPAADVAGPSDLFVRGATGESVPVISRCSPLTDSNGRVDGVVEAFWSADDDPASLQSAFLALASHELRSPLAAIKGIVSGLLREDVRWDEGIQRRFLLAVEEETDRLGDLVANLLDMSRIEAGALRVDREPCDLGEILDEARQRVAPMMAGREVEVTIAEGMPLVPADRQQVRQVVANLLDNAFKFSPPGSLVTVRAWSEDATARVSVRDRGPGIPPEETQRVFDKFFRGQLARLGRVRGTGLGLAIGRAMVEAHGGRIWLASAPGEGAEFVFELPLSAGRRFGG